jgi:NADH-quinone oxidoreductase subunit I
VRKLVDAIKNLFVGLFTTGKHLPRRHVTLQYPTERWNMPERSRGIVVLLSDKETGELNCTTCLLCARACPSGAITIDYEKDEKKKRHLKDFIVNNALCCYCGLCEEACNFTALKLATKYEFSNLDKESLIWHTDKLQEVGRDVPYEKKVRKKPAAKAAPKKPATPGGKPESVSKVDKSAEGEKTAPEPASPESGSKPGDQPAGAANNRDGRDEGRESEGDK